MDVLNAIRISDLRHHVDIEEQGANRDKYGGVDDTWTVVHSCRAYRGYLSQGTDEFAASRLTSIQKVGWTIRYNDDIRTDMRVVHNSKIYKVVAVQHWGNNLWTKIITELQE